MRTPTLTLALFVFTASIVACNSDPVADARKAAEEAAVAVEKARVAAEKARPKASPTEAAAKDLAKAAEGMGKAFGDMGAALAKAGTENTTPPVSFKELKKRLPKDVGGVSRTSAKGSSAGQMGFNVSQAEAVYKEGKKHAKVSIVDPGGFTGFLAMATWANVEIEEESDDGYKKTTLIDGHKAMEEFTKSTKRGKVHVIVAGRFVVEVTGTGIPMKDLKDALDDIDLGKLEKLAPAKP